jgi:N-acetylmuramoyl-L-alanine amidase
MKKKFEILMVACLFVSAFFLARAGAAFVASQNADTAKTCIVLDAGHGGSDPGKVGCNDTLEKDINLAIVYKLKTLFENKGFQVVLTRTDDTILADENAQNVKVEDLRNRVALITETMPVMTICIHQNSFPDSSVSGPQVFFFEQSAEGEAIAATLQNSLNTILEPEKPRVSKSNNDYYILKKTPTPTVIVECGFLSNEAEAAKLTDDTYQEKVARAIFQGACEYLSSNSDSLSDYEDSESATTSIPISTE